VLSITAAGRKALRDKRDARAELMATVLVADFTPEEIATLMSASPLIERLASRL
jgi:DNA-binding MarR family transcriptional regulator